MVWKDCRGFENLYQVSDSGLVRSVRTDKILKPSIGRDGYKKVIFSVKSKRYTFRVNRLVAEAFVPNPFNKPQVNHIDCDKLNNRADNLEWVTVKENALHASENGLLVGFKGESNPSSKLSIKEVDEIRKLWSTGLSMSYIAKMFGTCASNVYFIVKGITWKQ